MALRKDVKGLGMPWEEQYGYVQAVKVDDTIYVSGQLGLDDQGSMIYSNMETQMRQTYANAKKILSQFGATLENVVEEVLYVLDMETAFAAAGPVRKEAYASKRPAVASTIVVTPRLSLPTQLIEIKFIAKVR
jgi:enamine deaminase RidA (YjgF/YER057c/UK114 family)